MCGIFGYANYLTNKSKGEISDILINGLQRIEYRGYDSAGCTLQDTKNENFVLFREVGKVKKLKSYVESQKVLDLSEKVENHVGIAHTRWATHGQPSERNTHPLRSDKSGKFMCVHNGIITNYKELKSYLETKNFQFESETDTEVAAKLALLFYNSMVKKNENVTFVEIIKKVIKNCDGAYAFVFISTYFPNEMVAVRKSSPLLIGIKTDSKITFDFLDVNYGSKIDEEIVTMPANMSPMNSTEDLRLFNSFKMHHTDVDNNQMEIFLASDASAIIEHTKKVIYLEDDDIAHIAHGSLSIHRSNTRECDKNKQNTREIKNIETELAQIMKGNHEHFMMKEILEQPDSVVNTMRGRINFDKNEVILGGLQSYLRTIKKSTRLVFIACGTSYHSCMATRALFEELVDIPVQIELSSDFIDRRGLITRGDCCFFISQSGETADTILALRYCQERGALCIGISNTVGSTISRDTDCGVHINAGPEIGVASTKAYTSQYVSLVLISLLLSQDNLLYSERRKQIIAGLKNIDSLIKQTLKLGDSIKQMSYETLKNHQNMFIIGRGYQYATCMEGALKIKELTYIPTEGILAGELKHGPIALIDENVNVIIIVSNDRELVKTQNAVQQILARGAKPLIICNSELIPEFKGLHTIGVPSTVDCLQGLISILPMQLLAYHVAVAKGYDVDCPRNLAKSVTVE